MTRENLLFAIIGILLGFIVGFIFASTMSQRVPSNQMSAASQNLPGDHPQIGAANPANTGGMQTEVTDALAKARNEPQNFEAQMKAAELYYQIQRYDQSIEYLLRANQLKPDDYQTIVNLALVNLDAGKYEAAEKWYRAAIVKKPNEIPVLAGLAAATLGKGDAKAAEKAIADLEKADPTSQDLPQFKERLASLKK
jgi:tetratricopeptide (TPR) repeat protein